MENNYDYSLKPKMSIRHLARLTAVPYETLRYWAKKGYIRHSKNASNGYYEYDIDSYSDVTIIKMLRHIGFSFKMIVEYLEGEEDIFDKLFFEAKKRIYYQMEQLQKSLKNIEFQEKSLNRTKDYSQEITLNNPPFDKIFKLNSVDLTKNILTKPWNSISFYNVKENTVGPLEYACIVENIAKKGKVLWTKNANAKYFHFMVVAIQKQKSATEVISENVKKIDGMGYSVEFVLLKYVFTLKQPINGEKTYVNYYDAWAEVYPK